MGAERKRVGREVLYFPTDSEVTATGAGPYPAMITDVNSDGSVDLFVRVPSPTALTETSIQESDADATYGQPEADLINELKDRVDELLARADESRKTSVSEGEGEGQFTFRAGAGAV